MAARSCSVLAFLFLVENSYTTTLLLICLGNERILIDFKKDGKPAGFLPDGMTIDTNGFLYVATWGGSKIFKIDPK